MMLALAAAISDIIAGYVHAYVIAGGYEYAFCSCDT